MGGTQYKEYNKIIIIKLKLSMIHTIPILSTIIRIVNNLLQ